MKNELKSGLFAICLLAIGTMSSCKDAETTETENMETEVTTETMTVAEDTMMTDTTATMSESNTPGTTSGSMEQTP